MTTTTRRSPISPALTADLSLLGIAIAWGASYSIAKTALFYTSALVLIFLRFLITTVVMGGISLKELKQIKAGELKVALQLGFLLFCIFICETFGVSLTSAANTALIISLCVILTPIIEYGMRGKLPPTGIFVGCIMSIVGVWALTGGIQDLHLGDGLVLIAAVLRSIMVISTKRMLRHHTISSSALTALEGLTVTVLTLVILMALPNQHLRLPSSLDFWIAVLFLSLVCTILAFLVQNYTVRKTTPTRVNLLMGTEPLWGFICAWLLLGEQFSIGGVLGALLIVLGSILAIYTLTKQKSTEG